MCLAGISEHIKANNKRLHLHFDKTKTKRQAIPFKFVHNLIIVPVFINGSDTLNFILDTGVGNTMITSLNGMEGIQFNFARQITLYGLGEGSEIEAYHSYGNTMRLPGVVGYNKGIIILRENLHHLSQGLGTDIHGLIGYDLFESFVVEIDYEDKMLYLYSPEYYKKRIQKKRRKRGDVVPIEIVRRKPYVVTEIKDGENKIDLRLLIDSGASHALSLFQSTDERFTLPDNSLYTYIGIGLNGEIYGNICRQDTLKIGQYELVEPLVTFPDESAIAGKIKLTNRNGSLGAETLKRFRVVFDYDEGEMILKPNSYYKQSFKYNLSGMDIITPYPGLPYFQITKIRKGSPAWIAGLAEGDQIHSINGVETENYDLTRVIDLLQSKPGKKLRVVVKREEKYYATKFRLQDPIF
jgi:hypothetical protein